MCTSETNEFIWQLRENMQHVTTYDSVIKCVNDGRSFTLIFLTELINISAAWPLTCHWLYTCHTAAFAVQHCMVSAGLMLRFSETMVWSFQKMITRQYIQHTVYNNTDTSICSSFCVISYSQFCQHATNLNVHPLLPEPVSSNFLTTHAEPKSATFWSNSTSVVSPFFKFFFRPSGAHHYWDHFYFNFSETA